MFRSSLKAGITALALSFASVLPAGAGQWVLVGQQAVSKHVDFDTFAVGWGAGRYDALRFRVLGNRVAVGDVRVYYGNGTTEHLNVREHLAPGQTTVAYDLRGDHRVITRIEMLYQTSSYYGPPATMQVFGLRHEGGHGGGYPGGAGGPGYPSPGWEALGSKTVGFHVDHDTIAVGARHGRFRALRLDVHDRPIHLWSARVTFADGDVREVRVDRWLAADSTTGAVDLPGFQRAIERVDLVYRTRPNLHAQRARVTLYGLH